MRAITIETVVNDYGAIWYKELQNEWIIIVPLCFHVAVYIFPAYSRQHVDRYCIYSIALALEAISNYEQSRQMKYWQKHHTRNISVVGNRAYPSGALETAENVLFEVSWDTRQIEQQYPSYFEEMERLRIFGLG